MTKDLAAKMGESELSARLTAVQQTHVVTSLKNMNNLV